MLSRWGFFSEFSLLAPYKQIKSSRGKVSNFDKVEVGNPGPGCSKQMTLLVNVSLKFQTLIFEICQYFFVEKM